MADQVWFDVIALATSKGGAGKSTLARGLAAHWLALGRKPALIDADPTGTLSNRYNPEGPLGAVPVIAEPEERVSEAIEELRARHTPVIVDTAGFRNRTTISTLVAADLAIIPLKPAAEDLDAQEADGGGDQVAVLLELVEGPVAPAREIHLDAAGGTRSSRNVREVGFWEIANERASVGEKSVITGQVNSDRSGISNLRFGGYTST